MTASIILVVIALSLPLVLLRLSKGQRLAPEVLKNPGQYIRPVDLQAFRNLTDPAEEKYLRENLEPADFRSIQRERLLAAVDYISCVKDNAAILIQVGEEARKSSNPATAAAAVKLVDDAVRFRRYALITIPQLYLKIVWPTKGVPAGSLADSYEDIASRLTLLGSPRPVIQ